MEKLKSKNKLTIEQIKKIIKQMLEKIRERVKREKELSMSVNDINEHSTYYNVGKMEVLEDLLIMLEEEENNRK